MFHNYWYVFRRIIIDNNKPKRLLTRKEIPPRIVFADRKEILAKDIIDIQILLF